ncbi:MAG TPA: hypothetical protein VER58_09360 [Thermoanaerobaculia bacterium]|nr:hypothetical protein [Thermoanaerobaculia bacterium]
MKSALIVMVLADALTGTWILNRGRTHYGGGADVRQRETMTCESERHHVRCTINSKRSDGRTLVGRFAAGYDGKPGVATGIPDVDSVSLRGVDDHLADATFNFKGKPVFGYRMIKTDDEHSLIIVAVDPMTRKVLNSVVVYDRK